MRGLTIKSPFGADGTVTMRAEDQTLDRLRHRLGHDHPEEPYVPEVKSVRLEAASSSSKPSGRRTKGYT